MCEREARHAVARAMRPIVRAAAADGRSPQPRSMAGASQGLSASSRARRPPPVAATASGRMGDAIGEEMLSETKAFIRGGGSNCFKG